MDKSLKVRRVRLEDLSAGQPCLVPVGAFYKVEGRWVVDEEVDAFAYVIEPDE